MPPTIIIYYRCCWVKPRDEIEQKLPYKFIRSTYGQNIDEKVSFTLLFHIFGIMKIYYKNIRNIWNIIYYYLSYKTYKFYHDFHITIFRFTKFRTILSNDKSHFFIFYLAWTQYGGTILLHAIFWPLCYSHDKLIG